MEYGLQLYSVRDTASQDYEKALREVSAMGYRFVEPAGFFGHSAAQVKEWLDQYGLTISGTHSGFADLENDFSATVAYHQAIGNTKYIVPATALATKEDLDAAVAKFNKFGPMLADHGIALGYHNHNREFLPNQDGIIPHLYFAEHTDVQFEIDTFWVYAAGWDPLTVLRNYRSRLLNCLHLKDGRRYPEITGCALGEGSAPVRDVLALAKDWGLDVVVESEGLQPTGLEEVARCMSFLKANG